MTTKDDPVSLHVKMGELATVAVAVSFMLKFLDEGGKLPPPGNKMDAEALKCELHELCQLIQNVLITNMKADEVIRVTAMVKAFQNERKTH